MTAIKLPPQSELNKLFKYNPETGNLYRKISVSYNTRIGDKVGCPNNKGYSLVRIYGALYKVHRIIWKMCHGVDPEQIDHIDGNTSNNRIKNLRSVTQKKNNKNKKRCKDNASGHIGVSWYDQTNKWCAQIGVDKKRIHLGYFSNKDEAIKVRKEAEIKHGFHENHGRA